MGYFFYHVAFSPANKQYFTGPKGSKTNIFYAFQPKHCPNGSLKNDYQSHVKNVSINCRENTIRRSWSHNEDYTQSSANFSPEP